ICELLFVSKKSRYHSIKSNEEIKSLKEYVYKMEKQKHTYYITGASRANVEVSLFLEALKKIDLEVLFLVPIDVSAAQLLREYDGKKLICVAKECLVIPLTEEKKLEDEKVEYKSLTKKIKDILVHNVEKVIVSYRMVGSMCYLVTGEYGWSSYGKNYEGSSLKDNSMTQYTQSKKTMEVNPNNAIVINLKEKFAEDQSDKTIKDLVWLLFETALLISGFILEEAVKFAAIIKLTFQMSICFPFPSQRFLLQRLVCVLLVLLVFLLQCLLVAHLVKCIINLLFLIFMLNFIFLKNNYLFSNQIF
ncbi:hypothetical protein RFI_33171, partial [Reticulomyxa filosa]